MTTVKLKRGIAYIAVISAVTLFSACGENNSEDSATTVSSSEKTADIAADNTTEKPVAVKKKRTATVIFNKQNGLKVVKDKDGVYTNAEVMPEYPGGEAALAKYVENNIEYPQDAVDVTKEGTVNISFVVDEKGKVTQPIIAGNPVGEGLDEEAVKVVNQLPDWKPGTVKGKPVKTRLTLPITFRLAES